MRRVDPKLIAPAQFMRLLFADHLLFQSEEALRAFGSDDCVDGIRDERRRIAEKLEELQDAVYPVLGQMLKPSSP